MSLENEIAEFILEINKQKEQSIKEVASWDNPNLKRKDSDTISCDDDERYERIPIRKAVKEKFPNVFTDDEIDKAIEECCKKYNQTREREAFYKCVFVRLFSNI